MSNELIATSEAWDEDERQAIARIARLIIGADPEGVMPMVDDDLILPVILERATGFERPVRQGLAVLQTQAAAIEGLPDEELASLMQARDETQSLLRAMMQIVAQCYYEDNRVLALLGFEARPPFPEGHELEAGDWDLLAPVLARGNPATR